MLHEETVGPTTLALLTDLMNDSHLADFVLVGGTAIALQIGHRISVDLDLFTNQPFNETEIADYLRCNYNLQLDSLSKNTIRGEINGVQVDCIAHQYPWIDTFFEERAIRIAGLTDLAAMKLNAISGNGTRIKDFIDIAFLSDQLSLNQMLNGYQHKYNSNLLIPMKALVYFEEINYSEPIRMTNGIPFLWKQIEKRLLIMQKYPYKVFDRLS